jgi:hypothetical protein
MSSCEWLAQSSTFQVFHSASLATPRAANAGATKSRHGNAIEQGGAMTLLGIRKTRQTYKRHVSGITNPSDVGDASGKAPMRPSLSFLTLTASRPHYYCKLLACDKSLGVGRPCRSAFQRKNIDFRRQSPVPQSNAVALLPPHGISSRQNLMERNTFLYAALRNEDEIQFRTHLRRLVYLTYIFSRKRRRKKNILYYL